jgi:hypothetical protein
LEEKMPQEKIEEKIEDVVEEAPAAKPKKSTKKSSKKVVAPEPAPVEEEAVSPVRLSKKNAPAEDRVSNRRRN